VRDILLEAFGDDMKLLSEDMGCSPTMDETCINVNKKLDVFFKFEGNYI
jgi:hypothetical protein